MIPAEAEMMARDQVIPRDQQQDFAVERISQWRSEVSPAEVIPRYPVDSPDLLREGDFG